MVRVGILTSSRADFGVYLPLLRSLKDNSIDFELIIFGTHLSKFHGHTVDEIIQEGFHPNHTIETTLASDTEYSISTSAALTNIKFAEFWKIHSTRFSIVFCLGDRYEMCFAVLAGVPFGIKFAHLYGGDFSEGAIDNVYRNCLTHSSVVHFTSNKKLEKRITDMVNYYEHVETIGILSLTQINNEELHSIDEFKRIWKIDLNIPSILLTIHPETVNSYNNNQYLEVIRKVIVELRKKKQIIITLPNADTNGHLYRTLFNDLSQMYTNVKTVENLGRKSYFTCLKYCSFVMGNSSSGISEAASFKKYVVDIGKRQKGRIKGENVFSVDFDFTEIMNLVEMIDSYGDFNGTNIYHDETGVSKIINYLKKQYH